MDDDTAAQILHEALAVVQEEDKMFDSTSWSAFCCTDSMDALRLLSSQLRAAKLLLEIGRKSWHSKTSLCEQDPTRNQNHHKCAHAILPMCQQRMVALDSRVTHALALPMSERASNYHMSLPLGNDMWPLLLCRTAQTLSAARLLRR